MTCPPNTQDAVRKRADEERKHPAAWEMSEWVLARSEVQVQDGDTGPEPLARGWDLPPKGRRDNCRNGCRLGVLRPYPGVSLE